jgi:signal transduction histidine kinase
VVAGLVVLVHSLTWSGRYGWVAAAGLALAATGAGWFGAFAGWGWTASIDAWGIGPPLALSSLLVFVLASLRLESTRLRRASDRAAEVMEGRAEIAAAIAHDVRGPVGTIKGLATTTRKSYDRLDDDQRLEFVGMIETESARLLRLVDQVAVALKVDAGTLDLSPRLQEVAPLVELALRELEGADRVQVDADTAAEAAVDPRWFAEAVRQGLDNALGFSPGEAPVDLTLRAVGEDVVVEIADRGPGIPPERREELFEKFVRWRPAGYEDRQGSGLGLFVARGIARAHGGDASLDAAPEGGTMLRLRFPREAKG